MLALSLFGGDDSQEGRVVLLVLRASSAKTSPHLLTARENVRLSRVATKTIPHSRTARKRTCADVEKVQVKDYGVSGGCA